MTIRRRFIEEGDLSRVVELLARGFPARSLVYWTRGFEKLRQRRVPVGYPRYGLMLDDGARPVGVLLTIFADVELDGRRFTRCNLSSWYTEPSFGPYAPLLMSAALKDRDVTYINISPAFHTQPIIEAQGFRSFCRGSFLHLPVLSRSEQRADVVPLTTEDAAAYPEREVLESHLALGCLCFAAGKDREPFVFASPRRLKGMLPTTFLLYCRSLEGYARFARALGWVLLKRRIAAALVDTEQAMPGLRGRQINLRQNKYVLGPNPPRQGDLTYTELAVFGG